jgi:hypothetical protein
MRKNLQNTKKKTKRLSSFFRHQVGGVKSHCQCKTSCREFVEAGQMFCAKHQQGCNRVSPLSGSEPLYEPGLYNEYADMQNNHNCYAYAFDIKEDIETACKNRTDANGNCSLHFHQPGYSAGFKRFRDMSIIQCPDIAARIIADVPGAKISSFEEKCPIKTSKIGLVIDDKRDYHFYRQDRGGLWSHKPGSGKVTNRDANGNLIYDPALAARDYSKGVNDKLNYKYFCTYMCVPRGEGKRTFKMTRGGRRKLKYNQKSHRK